MIYAVTRAFLKVILKLFYRAEFYGFNDFPQKQGCILSSNHLSNLDPIALAVGSPRQLCFLSKIELFKNPVFAKIITALGAYPLKRGANDISAIKKTIALLKEGRVVVIFPQGTRDGKLDEESLSGVAYLAQKAEVDVIAAKIKGTDKALPKGSNKLKRSKVEVGFKKVEDIANSQSRKIIAKNILKTMDNL